MDDEEFDEALRVWSERSAAAFEALRTQAEAEMLESMRGAIDGWSRDALIQRIRWVSKTIGPQERPGSELAAVTVKAISDSLGPTRLQLQERADANDRPAPRPPDLILNLAIEYLKADFYLYLQPKFRRERWKPYSELSTRTQAKLDAQLTLFMAREGTRWTYDLEKHLEEHAMPPHMQRRLDSIRVQAMNRYWAEKKRKP